MASAATYFGGATNPTDNNPLTNAAARAVTPPGSMVAGQLVLVTVTVRNTADTVNISATGGQTWTAEANDQGANGTTTRHYCAVFNGTWSADPSWGTTDTSGVALTVAMAVFSPTAGYAWSCTPDVAQSQGDFSAPGGPPYDVTITGQTPTASASVVTFATWVNNNDTITWAVQTGGWSNANGTQIRSTTGTGLSTSYAYLIQSSASATGNVTNRESGPIAGQRQIITYKETLSVSVPTYSVAPAYASGTPRTTSSTSGTATIAANGASTTRYGVLVVDGSGAPTCTQIKAGQNSGGTSAVYASNASVTDGVAHTLTMSSMTGAGSGDTFDWYECASNSAGNSSVQSLADQYKVPGFVTTPSVSARASNTFTLSYRGDGAHTYYEVACAKGRTAPNFTQLKAGQCGGPVTADAAANESTSGAADTLLMTASSPLLVYDVYAGVEHSSAQSSVTTLATECAGAASGFDTCFALTSVNPSTACPVQAYNDAAGTTNLVTGDYCSGSLVTDPDGYKDDALGKINWETLDGCFSYDGPPTPQSLQIKCQDVSAFAMATGLNPGTFYVNWPTPVCSPPSIELKGMKINVAMSAVPLASQCSDSLGGALTYAVTTGTLPTGVSLSSDGILTGTPTTEAITTVVITATNVAGKTATITVIFYVFDTVTLPDGVGDQFSDYDAALDALNAGLTSDISDTECSTETPGEILSQNPAASSEVEPNSAVELVIAKRCGSSRSKKWWTWFDLPEGEAP